MIHDERIPTLQGKNSRLARLVRPRAGITPKPEEPRSKFQEPTSIFQKAYLALGTWFMVLGIFCLSGCAALTNPVANGVPVRRLPPELLGEPKEGERPLPLTLLRQKPPDPYRLGPGDLLGIWAEGALGERAAPPPINFPESRVLPPAVGFPFQFARMVRCRSRISSR